MNDVAANGRDPGPDALRVLLVNEPRAYREALAATLQALRPGMRVASAEPEMLGYQLGSFAPHLIIGSRLAPDTRNTVRAWVELYPDHGSLSRVGVDGRDSPVDGMELEDLLALLDRLQTTIREPKRIGERRIC